MFIAQGRARQREAEAVSAMATAKRTIKVLLQMDDRAPVQAAVVTLHTTESVRPMNRREAIQHVLQLNADVAGEILHYEAARNESDRDTADALRALGVTDAEIEEAEKS